MSSEKSFSTDKGLSGGAAGGFGSILERVAARARREGVFGSVRVEGEMLRCEAAASAEPSEYRVVMDKGTIWVSLATAHRWLSQSIEADLVNTGDKIEELLEEELVDLGWDKRWGSARLPYEHFRDEQKLYTFRTPVPGKAGTAEAEELAAMVLLGYERTFRVLGDMEGGDEE